MALNVPLLRESFALVAEREPTLAARFYSILFARYPQVQPLFGRHSGEHQQKMLTSMLVSVLDHLDDVPWLQSELGALGQRHVGYAVTHDMYPMVGESLLATLAEIAGDDWSPAHADAWTEAYGAIVSLMIAGTDTSSPEA